jgi:hypothetical protein
VSLYVKLGTTASAALCGSSLLMYALAAADPFQFFRPDVSLNQSERTTLERGEVLVKTLDAGGREVAVFAAARVSIDGDRLARWIRRIQDLKQSRYVLAIGRFSDPPRVDDLASLELDENELADLRKCRPGDCGLKLSEAEIIRLSALARQGTADWKADVQQAFRELLVARAAQYLAGGLGSAPPYADRSTPIPLDRESAELAEHSRFLGQHVPQLLESVVRYPAGGTIGAERFLYWSRELFGGSPVTSITHVTLARHDSDSLPPALVVSRQVYANHYMTGSLAVTAIVAGRGGRPAYLVYLNRSRVDLLDRFFGGLVRRIMAGRLRDNAATVIDALRQRLQSGDPPA